MLEKTEEAQQVIPDESGAAGVPMVIHLDANDDVFALSDKIYASIGGQGPTPANLVKGLMFSLEVQRLQIQKMLSGAEVKQADAQQDA